MALGTNHLYNNAASVAEFIPELWSDDIIAAYKSNLVLANLVSKINHKGKKGDTIHIPSPTRGSANAKAVATQVVLNQNNSTEIQVSINKHYEYSIIIEDILEVQALPSLRRFHTDDAGYALAKQIDQDLALLWAGLQGGDSATWDKAVAGDDGSTLAFISGGAVNAANLADAGIRKMIQTLDDQDVPMSERYLVIPPSQRNVLMGLSRFTEQAFTGEMGGGNTIRNGQIGDIYGVKVFVTTNCPWVAIDDATAPITITADTDIATAFTDTAFSGTGTDVLGNSYNFAATPTDYRVGALMHKDALILAEQMGIRAQTQYKQEYLGTLMTSDCLYGVAEARDYAGVAFGVPA